MPQELSTQPIVIQTHFRLRNCNQIYKNRYESPIKKLQLKRVRLIHIINDSANIDQISPEFNLRNTCSIENVKS